MNVKKNKIIFNSEIIENRKISGNIYHLKLIVKENLIFQPGQFINILINEDYDIFLRRPFSVFNKTNKILEIIYKVIGKGTERLSKKKKGDLINILGPLGNSYIDFIDKNNIAEKDILLVAGGTGIASVYFFAKWLYDKNSNFKLLYGAKTKKEIIFNKFFKKFNALFSTDDGSYGKKGPITKFIKKSIDNNSIIFACGPEPMLKALQNLNLKNEIYASFESYMGCGYGVCLSCVIPVKVDNGFEYHRVCKEGPIFDLKKVIFEGKTNAN